MVGGEEVPKKTSYSAAPRTAFHKRGLLRKTLVAPFGRPTVTALGGLTGVGSTSVIVVNAAIGVSVSPPGPRATTFQR